MCEVVQEYLPVLRPMVEVNVARPDCWNQDGHDDSVESWIEAPTYSF